MEVEATLATLFLRLSGGDSNERLVDAVGAGNGLSSSLGACGRFIAVVGLNTDRLIGAATGCLAASSSESSRSMTTGLAEGVCRRCVEVIGEVGEEDGRGIA